MDFTWRNNALQKGQYSMAKSFHGKGGGDKQTLTLAVGEMVVTVTMFTYLAPHGVFNTSVRTRIGHIMMKTDRGREISCGAYDAVYGMRQDCFYKQHSS